MKRVYYSEKPSVFQKFQNGDINYCWDIQEIQSEDNTISQWGCYQVSLHQPIDKEMLTKAVIAAIWDNDLEKKLINDYNGAKEGLFEEVINQKYIDAYNDFLIQRKVIKEQIDLDWNNIYGKDKNKI